MSVPHLFPSLLLPGIVLSAGSIAQPAFFGNRAVMTGQDLILPLLVSPWPTTKIIEITARQGTFLFFPGLHSCGIAMQRATCPDTFP